MNWYKKYRYSGKTYRDTHNTKMLYHVSPENLSVLKPLSKFSSYTGLFMSPSYRSIIQDWAMYVKDKKHYTHLDEIHDKIINEIHKIEYVSGSYKQAKDPSEQLRLDNLWNELDGINKSMGSDKYRDATEGYKTLYIHKIICPMETYRECININHEVFESGYQKENLGFWCWGSQVFIPAEYLSKLEIVSIEALNTGELIDKYQNFIRGRERATRPSMKLSPEEMAKFEEEEKLTPLQRQDKKKSEDREKFLKGLKQDRLRNEKDKKDRQREEELELKLRWVSPK